MMMRWWWDDDDDLEGGDLNDGDFENDMGCDVDPTCSAKLALNAHQVDDRDGRNFDKSDYHDENILKIVAVVTIQLFFAKLSLQGVPKNVVLEFLQNRSIGPVWATGPSWS